MKKTISMLAMLLLTIGMVSATTTVDINWDGAGSLGGVATMGNDHISTFSTEGNTIIGNFHVVDSENNPYNYGVNSVDSYINAQVINGGLINYQADRTDSYSPMYGSAGQQMFASVYSSDGNAAMATGFNSNYAAGGVATYGKPHTAGGYNFEATGTSFEIIQQVKDGSGDGAFVDSWGSGTSKINAMSSDLGGSSFTLGKGAGCYTNANVVATGTGHLVVNSWADNSINVDAGSVVIPGDGSANSATYNLAIGYSGNFNYGNFALSGN